MFPRILGLAVKLANKGLDYAVKCLLVGIVEVEVEVEERLTGKGLLQIFNNSGTEDRLATSRYAAKPQGGVPLRLLLDERMSLQELMSCAFLALL